MLLERGEDGRRSEHVDPDRGDGVGRCLRGNRDAGEVHDGVGARARERTLDILETSDVTFMDTHAILDRLEVPERRTFVREAVDLVTARHEVLREVTAGEAGDAGDEDAEHGRIVPRMVRACPARS